MNVTMNPRKMGFVIWERLTGLHDGEWRSNKTGQAPLITNPPPTSSTTLFKKKKLTLKIKNCHMGHMTRDM